MKLSELVMKLMAEVRDIVQPALDGLAREVREALRLEREDAATRFVGRDELPGLIDKRISLPTPEPGADGRNAYEVAVSLGFGGTVYEWMDSLQGKDGDSVTADDVLPVLRKELGELVAAIPPPKDGNDGTSVTADDVLPVLEDLVKALPPAKDGKDGDSVTADDVLPVLRKELGELVAAIPPPKDGNDGTSVTVDDIRPIFDQSMATWALEFERRAMDLHQRLIDRFEKPKDGKDALELADFKLELGADERTLTLVLERDDRREERSLRLTHVLDRGVWKDKHPYLKGDGVTYGGSFWIAQQDAPAGKPGTSKHWRLAVRHGRDHKPKDD
jgi:hypothetical protein